jgi:uracil phosphoribosyltransferase
VKHWLAVARNAATPPQLFRSACAELGRILIYEAVREFLPTTQGVVDTPMGPSDVEFVDPRRPIKVGTLCMMAAAAAAAAEVAGEASAVAAAQ